MGRWFMDNLSPPNQEYISTVLPINTTTVSYRTLYQAKKFSVYLFRFLWFEQQKHFNALKFPSLPVLRENESHICVSSTLLCIYRVVQDSNDGEPKHATMLVSQWHPRLCCYSSKVNYQLKRKTWIWRFISLDCRHITWRPDEFLKNGWLSEYFAL